MISSTPSNYFRVFKGNKRNSNRRKKTKTKNKQRKRRRKTSNKCKAQFKQCAKTPKTTQKSRCKNAKILTNFKPRDRFYSKVVNFFFLNNTFKLSNTLVPQKASAKSNDWQIGLLNAHSTHMDGMGVPRCP